MPIQDDSLVAKYIRSIENPDSIGFKDGRWVAPPAGYDPNNRGFGVDIKYNDAANDLTNDRSGRWLSEGEERQLRNNHIENMQAVLDKWTPKILAQEPSEKKQAMAIGLLYRGDGIKSIKDNPVMRDAYYSGTDQDFQNAVADLYRKKKVSERAKQHNQFMNRVPSKPQVTTTSITKFTPPTAFKPKFKFGDGGSLNKGWDSLSLADKADMIKVAINNGIVTLPEIKEAYNKFAEGGYKDWLRELSVKKSAEWGVPQEQLYQEMQNDPTYDYKVFYEQQPDMAKAMLTADPEAHFNDVGKTPNHPTYSDGSYYNTHSYNGQAPFRGGHWSNGNLGPYSSTYQLSQDQLNHRWDIGRTIDYVSQAEPNGIEILNPKGTHVRDADGTIFGGVLPQVMVGNYAKGGNLYKKGGSMNANSQRAMSYLLGRGISKTGASAIVGTLYAESGLDPTVHAKMKGDSGVGLAQWTGGRQKKFWSTLEKIEPGARKKYGSIDRVPLERQLDVVLTERPDVTRAISNAKDVGTATDIMLRGYENGGGTVKSMISKAQMDGIYGKWGNGYDKQLSKRIGHASNLLGLHIDPSAYTLPQSFFDDINSQIANLPSEADMQIPTMQVPSITEVDPTTVYKAPVIDMSLFEQPKQAVETVYNPKEERVNSIDRLNNVFTLMGMQSPVSSMSNNPLMAIANI